VFRRRRRRKVQSGLNREVNDMPFTMLGYRQSFIYCYKRHPSPLSGRRMSSMSALVVLVFVLVLVLVLYL
jgi:hypothetical protein